MLTLPQEPEFIWIDLTILNFVKNTKFLGFWMYGHESLFAHHQIQAEAIPALSTLYGLRHGLNG